MLPDQDKPSTNPAHREPNVLPATEVVQNPNPAANENIRVRTAEPQPEDNKPAQGVGSEITDGEDG
jgi:hypothetical protein